MNLSLFERLHQQQVISDTSFQKLKQSNQNPLLSVHWELKTLLYTGVVLLSAGLGLLIYKNIDTIGHQAIVAFVGLFSGVSFYYCVKHKWPYSLVKVEAPNQFFDYVLLLACLTFITFIGYLQFEYNVFSNRYGLATFIPMVVLFFCAYFFDHLGVLSLAITNLAAWAGIAVTPTRILADNDFNSDRIIYTGLLLGAALVAAGVISKRKMFKQHFDFTYTNFGTHLLFISCLAGMFNFTGLYLGWFLVLAGICLYFYTKAVKEKSFYFLLLVSLYGYIGFSKVLTRLAFANYLGEATLYIVIIYFMLSAIFLAFFLISMNKKLKA